MKDYHEDSLWRLRQIKTPVRAFAYAGVAAETLKTAYASTGIKAMHDDGLLECRCQGNCFCFYYTEAAEQLHKLLRL